MFTHKEMSLVWKTLIDSKATYWDEEWSCKGCYTTYGIPVEHMKRALRHSLDYLTAHSDYNPAGFLGTENWSYGLTNRDVGNYVLKQVVESLGGVAGKLRIKDEECHDDCLIDGVETQSILR